jgi:hypothetical protein
MQEILNLVGDLEALAFRLTMFIVALIGLANFIIWSWRQK